jgi:hypothetical protein
MIAPTADTPSKKYGEPETTQASYNDLDSLPIENSKRYALCLLALALIFAVFTRLHHLAIPLERDEGEYAYLAQLILSGEKPYADAATMKLPGTHLAYAFFMKAFGENEQGIRFGLIIIDTLNILLVYALCRRFLPSVQSSLASNIYAVLSISPAVFGMAAHASHFINTPVLGGMLLLSAPFASHGKGNILRVCTAGLLFGLAFIMKQHGLIFGLVGLALLAFEIRRVSPTPRLACVHIIAFLFSLLLPYLSVCYWMFSRDVFFDFWFWTCSYSLEYASEVSIAHWPNVFWINFQHVIEFSYPIWIGAGIGFVFLCTIKNSCLQKRALQCLVIASVLSIMPGGYFRAHYFIQLLPAVSILLVIGVNSLTNYLGRQLSPLSKIIATGTITLGLMTIGLHGQIHTLYTEDPHRTVREIYPYNPFAEIREISTYIESNTQPNDRILVLGSEPQLYFHTRRRSSTKYIYMYPLMEQQPFALRMQQQLAFDIENNPPRFIVFVNSYGSWMRTPQSHRLIFDWLSTQSNRYKLLAVANLGPKSTGWDWVSDTHVPTPIADRSILLSERIHN